MLKPLGGRPGYFLGYSGRGVGGERRVSQRLGAWMRRRGWLLLFSPSVHSQPAFDLAGVTAWALSYPLKRFLAVVLTGKILKFVSFVCLYLRHYRGLAGSFLPRQPMKRTSRA